MDALYKIVDGKQVLMAPEEAAELRAEWAANAAALVKRQALDEINSIERETMVPRIVREFMIKSAHEKAEAEAAENGTTIEQELAKIGGYDKVMAVEMKIRDLRKLLK